MWYEGENKSAVLSTRIRLARNLDGVPFPSRLEMSAKRSVNESIARAVAGASLPGGKYKRIDMDDISEVEIYSMVEKHLISPQFASSDKSGILFLSEDGTVSIMIGEEDHIRVQVIKGGLDVENALSICSAVDDAISGVLNIAFDPKLGYLTACPTNLGTGMRASVMMHLPMLEKSGELGTISSAMGKLGLVFRGFYGEGSKATASVYQLSNQVTLGTSESSAAEGLVSIANQITGREAALMAAADKVSLADICCRSFGILKYARKLGTAEMMSRVSDIMLGQRAEVISLPYGVQPFNIFISMQPATLTLQKGSSASNDTDVLRADSVRGLLKGIEI